jgi:predicted O-methyltransferase YrrM
MRARAILSVPGVRPAAGLVARLASRRSAARAADRLAAAGHPVAGAYADALRDLHRPLTDDERATFAPIEALRRRLSSSDAVVEMADFGAGTRRGGAGAGGAEIAHRERATTVAEITRSTSKPARWARFLFHVVHRTGATTAIELGTSMGISAAYQASALQRAAGGRLITIEGSPSSAALAEGHLRGLHLLPGTVTVRAGRFDEALPEVLAELPPVDYVFVDGHHDEHATQAYFAAVKPHLASGATLVFDDIRWSDGMLRAWEAIRADPDVAVALDCGGVGIVCVDPGATGVASARARVA